MTGPSFSPPPASGDFSKFLDFAKLFANPKELSKHTEQYEKATKEYNKAAKDYASALKIAATLEEANAIKERNEGEDSRIKSQNTDLDSRLASIDTEILAKKAVFTADAEEVKEALEERETIHLDAVAKFEASIVKQEEAMKKREDALNEGERNLERELGAIKEKKARVDEAYAG